MQYKNLFGRYEYISSYLISYEYSVHMTEREILVHCPARNIPDGRRNGPRLSIKSNIHFCEIRRSIGIYHAILGWGM